MLDLLGATSPFFFSSSGRSGRAAAEPVGSAGKRWCRGVGETDEAHERTSLSQFVRGKSGAALLIGSRKVLIANGLTCFTQVAARQQYS